MILSKVPRCDLYYSLTCLAVMTDPNVLGLAVMPDPKYLGLKTMLGLDDLDLAVMLI